MIDRKDSNSKLDILVDSSRTEIIIRMNDAAVPSTQNAARRAFCGRGAMIPAVSAIVWCFQAVGRQYGLPFRDTVRSVMMSESII